MTLIAPTTAVRFRLVDEAGESLQPLVLNAGERPDRFSGDVVPVSPQFRILAEGTDDRGYPFQRVYPRLIEAKSTLP